MVKKTVFVSLCFMFTNQIFANQIFLSQSQKTDEVREYRHLINKAITYYCDNEYQNALDLFNQIDLKICFLDDLEVFSRSIDSLNAQGISRKKNTRIYHKIQNLTESANQNNRVYFNTGNKIVDGKNTGEGVKPRPIQLKNNEVYLLNIILNDRYISAIRSSTTINDSVEEILYQVAAENILAVFENIELPDRVLGDFWNDDLSLALIHGLKTLSIEQRERLLKRLLYHSKIGNISNSQYSVFFDACFSALKYGINFYGSNSEIKGYDAVNNQIEYYVKCFDDIKLVNTRRAEIDLPSIELWMNYKKLTYDPNCN